MEYATFKALQALLFFGSAMGFCIWQLAVMRRIRREDEAARTREDERPRSARAAATDPARRQP
jgi:hypothetical protein